MILTYGEIRPGIVNKVLDSFGTIKAEVAGLFSLEDDPETLPPIYPFCKASPTAFCNPHEGDRIWVLLFRDNPQELFYFFQGDVAAQGEVNMEGKTDVEILLKKDAGLNGAVLMFSKGDDEDTTGWIMQNDGSFIQIKNNGTVVIAGPHTITIDASGIKLGGDDHPVALGDKVQDSLKKLSTAIMKLGEIASANSVTAPIGAFITGGGFGMFESSLGDISSSTTKTK